MFVRYNKRKKNQLNVYEKQELRMLPPTYGSCVSLSIALRAIIYQLIFDLHF
jgi:hypothetical protein